MIQSTGNIRKSQQSRHPVHLTSQQTCFRLGNSISIKTTIMESISCGLDSWNGTSLTFNDFANLLKRNLLSRITGRINSSINRLLTFKCPFNRPLINLVIHPLVAISCDNVVTNELIKFLSSIDPMSQIPLSLTNLSVVCMTTKILLIIRHKNTANWMSEMSLLKSGFWTLSPLLRLSPSVQSSRTSLARRPFCCCAYYSCHKLKIHQFTTNHFNAIVFSHPKPDYIKIRVSPPDLLWVGQDLQLQATTVYVSTRRQHHPTWN